MCVIMSNLKHLLFVILGGIVLSSADAVGSDTCYKCVNCKDTPIDKIHTVRCSGSCFKMHGENDDGHENVNRGCLTLFEGMAFGAESATCLAGKVGKSYGEICICNGDKCNTGSSLVGSISLIISVIAMCLA
ncbi:uncharacterized protein LOC128242137 isoform X1 [Mya arenaria]|nr:uncharacterized protein LOC128242137 isoform X1 [Mya arenaria]